MDDMRIDILRKVEAGELTPEQALILMQTPEEEQAQETQEEQVDYNDENPVPGSEAYYHQEHKPEPALEEDLSRLAQWKQWWVYPFWAGIFIMVGSAALMYWGYTSGGYSWGFFLSWIPFFIGVIIMLLAWWSNTARWLHVRVTENKRSKRPHHITISFPLPLKLAGFGVRLASNFSPELKEKHVHEILDSVNESLNANEPFYIHVEEDDEDVEVYIG